MPPTLRLCVLASVLLAVIAVPIDVVDRDFAPVGTPTWKLDFWKSTPVSENKRAEVGTPVWKLNSISHSFSVEDKFAECETTWKRSVNDAVPPIEPGTPAWKRTAEAGAPGWKRADQGAPGWKRAFNGVPGW
ncbi:hypothetical protein J132_00249 [Termitomyces sp. J132]|nr:hypothetical protein H2248_012324 [Termitomyces sp. 'cryptogamus']KNZ76095.1 hypothetical protein J132_00249 [Termitomyces sp. J132]